jgi:predicted DCC family thiol-disulfide oxidoreductase YuxK
MNKELTTSTQTTMFYDGACSLCQREVAHYRRLDQQNHINWVDISTSADELYAHGIDYDTAMSRLHVLDEHGNMHSGVKAFLIIWSALPYYRWLAVVVKKMRITPVLEWAYQRFARWRLGRQGSCDCSLKSDNRCVNSAPLSRNKDNV